MQVDTKPTFDFDTFFNEGYFAYVNDSKRTDNPYEKNPPGTPKYSYGEKYNAWDSGWSEAHYEATSEEDYDGLLDEDFDDEEPY